MGEIGLRWILAIIGLVVIAAIYLWGMRTRIKEKMREDKIRTRIYSLDNQPELDLSDSDIPQHGFGDFNDIPKNHHLADKMLVDVEIKPIERNNGVWHEPQSMAQEPVTKVDEKSTQEASAKEIEEVPEKALAQEFEEVFEKISEQKSKEPVGELPQEIPKDRSKEPELPKDSAQESPKEPKLPKDSAKESAQEPKLPKDSAQESPKEPELPKDSAQESPKELPRKPLDEPPREQRSEPSREQPKEQSPETAEKPKMRVLLTVMAPPGRPYRGSSILLTAQELKLKLHRSGVFDCFPEGRVQGKPVFSIAHLREPGTFDLDTIGNLSTPGLLMYMHLPGPLVPVKAIELLLDIAKQLTQHLGGTLCDERHNKLTMQNILHLKGKAAEFDQQLRQSQPHH